MRRLNKYFLVALLGLLFAVAGGFLRVNAKTLASRTFAHAPVAPGGKTLEGSITFTWENPARAAAFADIGRVSLCAGAALLIIAIGAWVLEDGASSREMKARRWALKFRWPFWKRANP